jgi:hypothetical protein
MCDAHAYVLAFILAAGPAAGRASDQSGGMAKLFEVGAKSTPPAVAAGWAQYEQLKSADPNDPRIDYAYALVLLNQHKYRDALPLVSRYLETGKGELGAYRVKMWAQIQDRRYPDVLDAAIALSQRIAEDTADGADSLEAARFLGTVFGYLELARPTVVHAELRLARRKLVLARLGESYTSVFDEGRDGVAKLVENLQTERANELKEVAAATERRQEEAKAVLDKHKTKIADQKETMQSSEEQLRDAQRQLNVLQTQLANLQSDRSRLSAQIIILQAQITQLQPDYLNPFTRTATYFLSSAETRAKVSKLDLTLTSLNKQASAMDQKISGLQERIKSLTAKGQQESQSIAVGEAEVRQAEKHAKAIETQSLRRPAAPSSRRANALAVKITTFATYAPFPFEQEKQRVLDWFAN